MSTLSITADSGREPSERQDALSIFTSQAGGVRFAIAADDVTDVVPLTSEQIESKLLEFDTPEGKIPVVSFCELLSHKFGIQFESAQKDALLVVLANGDQRGGIRMGEVSEPIELCHSKVFRIPQIAFPDDLGDFFHGVAVSDANSEDPNDGLSLLINISRLMGHDTETKNWLTKTVSKKQSLCETSGNRSSTRQLVIFNPEDAAGADDRGYRFCLPVVAVAEVTSALPLLQLPSSSPLLFGYALWRKLPVPIIDLGTCFDLKSSSPLPEHDLPRRRLIIARIQGNRYVGFFAQSQLQLLKTVPKITATSNALVGQPTLGQFETDYGWLVIPDLLSILDSVGQALTS